MNFSREDYLIKVYNVVEIVDSIRPHWARCEGDVNNDKQFWNTVIHKITPEQWWDWCDIKDIMASYFPEEFDQYRTIHDDTDLIRGRLLCEQPVTRRNKEGANLAAFRALMVIKDIIGELSNTPFKRYPKKTERERSYLSQVLAQEKQLKRVFK
jgi:hypothetical protein